MTTPSTFFNAYLTEIAKITRQGDAREESYYPALEHMLETFARDAIGRKAIEVTTLPKRTEAGNPDFRVWEGHQRIVGYIEAKAPGTNLERIETGEQLSRYRGTFPNLILTDFYKFRLYRDGVLIDQVQLARPFIARDLKLTPPLEKAEALTALLQRFLSFVLPRRFTAKTLAVELAKRTRFLRDQVIAEELRDRKHGSGLHDFYEAFQKYLISGLTEQQFADLYAQTITYGLFAARTRAGQNFNRKLAYDLIPPTVGILRDVFRFISLGDLPKPMEVMVDDIADVLSAADVRTILQQFYREGKGEDPILHFYETFLAQYDPTTRERRGVYYTPEPVVRYIVRGLHRLLQTHFDMPDGLAAEGVTLLDPAAGTLTFPAEAIRLAATHYAETYGRGGLRNFIRRHILRNFYAFEIMMAPYAIGHMKIGFLLTELGYPMGEDERFPLYLTNTLEMEDLAQIHIPGIGSLSEESRLAGKVKKEEPILVILGNPPYSGISANTNEWTEKLLKTDLDGAQSYYTVDGKPLGERNPKWLQDDYVKFLRFAQWKIQRAGRGLVGMITNHSYLDNPTFRGMRQSLLSTFDEIYILNLHGNSLRRETAPDGGPDENVFDIRMGVAIALFIKRPRPAGETKPPARVFYADLWGKRAEKYAWMEAHTFTSADFTEIHPRTPYYFFTHRNTAGIQHFLDWPRINKIFPVNSVGIVTSRDKFVIDFDRNALENRIRQFREATLPDNLLAQAFGLREKKDWTVASARKALQDDADWDHHFHPILYRPFDERFIFYHEALIERSRRDVMRHMLAGENLGICFMRQFSGDMPFSHFLISEHIVDNRTFFSSRGIIQLAPLYLYPDDASGLQQGNLFQRPVTEKTPNIPAALFHALADAYGFTPAPEDILAYIYAIFYSTIYREKYEPFLRVDFPRVPFTARAEVFRQLAALGQRLIALHLLKSRELHPPIARFQGEGDDIIGRVRYDETQGHVYINKTQYFEGITPVMWHYQIGGYQVLHKYLKDRKGRRMDDARRYVRIATAIARTIALQAEIDALYPQAEAQVLPLDELFQQ